MKCESIYLMVKNSFYNQQLTCPTTIIREIDFTMKSKLKHSWEEKAKEGKMTMDEWPKIVQNKLKKDNGRIPLDILETILFVNFNHRVKTAGKSVYALATLPKCDSSLTNEIAKRIKIRWDTMLKQISHLKWDGKNKKIQKRY